MKQGNGKFKVGDIVKITHYNEELDLWWNKETIGNVESVVGKNARV